MSLTKRTIVGIVIIILSVSVLNKQRWVCGYSFSPQKEVYAESSVIMGKYL